MFSGVSSMVKEPTGSPQVRRGRRPVELGSDELALVTARFAPQEETTWSVGELAAEPPALEEAVPIRRFPAYRQKRSREGWWYFTPTGRLVGCESGLEMQAVSLLEFGGAVAVASQPARIVWPGGRSHVPDFFVRQSDGSGLWVDVRPVKRAGDPVFAATGAVAASVGWGYLLFEGLDRAPAALLSTLASYRTARSAPPDAEVAPLVEEIGVPPYGEAILRYSKSHGWPVPVVTMWVSWAMWHRWIPVDFGLGYAGLVR